MSEHEPRHMKSKGPAAEAPARREVAAAQPVSRAPRAVLALFVAVCALGCLVPFVGMLWAPTTTTTENRTLAEVPSLVGEDGALNTAYLSDWGTYFEDHFAYRNELVDLNATIRAALLGDSAADTVVVGTDGWLYYAGTLADYCGYSLLSTRGIDNVAFNLALMQEYVEEQGADFIVTFAPNKNTVYGQDMPYWYLAGSSRNLTSLVEALEGYGVAYCDLEAAFESAIASGSDTLYYLRDSHWNTKGALLAANTLLDDLGVAAAVPEGAEPVEVDYVGDLASMLYPISAPSETDWSFDAYLDWSYVEGEAVDDSWVATAGAGTGTLLMFRDSFTNNMMGFLATAFETSYFSKYVPYDLTLVESLGATTVVIERAERSLSDLGENPAIMPAPSTELEGLVDAEDLVLAGASVEMDGNFLVVEGDLPEAWWDDSTEIYIGIERADGTVSWYVPFHTTTDVGDWGYKAYLDEAAYTDAQCVWIACTVDGQAVRVAYQVIDE